LDKKSRTSEEPGAKSSTRASSAADSKQEGSRRAFLATTRNTKSPSGEATERKQREGNYPSSRRIMGWVRMV
jgi:hypothetical protein